MKFCVEHRSIRPVRRGHVTVEMALILPITLSLFLGSVEFTRINTLINGAESAAYEGARRGILPGATIGQCQQEANRILEANGVLSATVDGTSSTEWCRPNHGDGDDPVVAKHLGRRHVRKRPAGGEELHVDS